MIRNLFALLILLSLAGFTTVGCVAGGPAADGDGEPGVDPGPTMEADPNPGVDPGPGPNPTPDPVDPLLPPQCQPSAEVCDGLDNDCNGEVDDNLACACTGDNSCYGGPAQTRGIGACTDGSRSCDGEFFGACDGWVDPVEEVCDDNIDNDCDGDTDEGACREVCQPGDMRECLEGADPALIGVGICEAGSQVCDAERRWGPCMGGVGPQSEICDDNQDNDCDGVIDTDCRDDVPDEEDRFNVSEQVEEKPVDFIMVIDNSGSMRDTVAQVERNIGAFATRLVDSDIDYRFIVVSERGTDPSEPDVCIPAPMSGGNCSNSRRFRHASQEIGSHDAYQRAIQCFTGCGRSDRQMYGDFVRDNSLKQFVIVSDDESDSGWAPFRDTMQGLLGGFILNGVIGIQGGGCVENIGQRYIEGANETGGELLNICNQDWGEVLDVLFNATIRQLTSTFELSGQPIPETVRVFTSTGGTETEQIGTWTYNAGNNAVTFNDTSALGDGVTVIIRYKPL